jgi:cytochrome c oxidase subunit II
MSAAAGRPAMHVDRYERIWMWGVGVMLVLFFASTAVAALRGSVHPPSHVETIDPAALMRDPRFRAPGVFRGDGGALHVTVVGLTFAWLPQSFVVPANRPITFHVSAMDVVHGFQIVRTNGQAMAIPGYVSRFTTTFADTGEYLIVCNEYCGVGHHTMASRMRVVAPARFVPPAATLPPAPAARAAGGSHGR